jgi:hypothetical protein
MDALTKEKEEPQEASGAGEFYFVAATAGTWYVSAETASRIGSQLDRRMRPRWIKFVDRYGARVWLRTETVDAVYESTEPIRARSREFHSSWRKEEQSDRQWDDEGP